MISRAQNSQFANWWWTIDRALLAALGLLMIFGIVLAMAGSPAVAERLGLSTFYFVHHQIMFMIPAGTMRLLADEKASGTLELLSTMPVRDWEVVVGKFLAALALVATAIGLTIVFAISVRFLGPLDRGPAIGGYIGALLMGGAYVSIGVMCSAFSRNSIVAFIASFGISFALYLFGRLTQFVPEALQPLVAFLSIDGHFESIGRGVVDTRDVIYYLSVIGTCLLVATTALESRRWK